MLESVERGDLDKVMIFVPPRHGKTYHVSERFPAWCEGRHPQWQQIVASYAQELAVKSSRKARNLLEEPTWPFSGIGLSGNSAAAHRWETNKGGIILATGIGGAATGFGAHLLVIDDPFKNREEADSQVYRDRAFEWYQDVARTRLMRGGRQIIMLTRWHEDGLEGRILNSPGASEWHVLSMPALAREDNPNDPTTDAAWCARHGFAPRQIGEALWPDGPPLPSVAKGEISSRSWHALYQQNPQPDDGFMFRREWMARRWTDERALPEWKDSVAVVDGAWKEGVGNDSSAFAVWATDGIDYYLLDGWAEQQEYPKMKRRAVASFTDARERFGVPRIFAVEDAASGIGLLQEVRRETNIPTVALKPQGSKVSRAEEVTPLFEAGKIVLPGNAPWLERWIDQHLRFPNGAHDDWVDTTAYALRRLSQKTRIAFTSLNTRRQ